MKKASIISIGNELLAGQITDTNAAYLSDRLLCVGISTVSSFTIADEADAIVRALNQAAADADIVLATGGLGPTNDDLTRQGLAGFLGVELQLRDELLQKIEDFFTRRSLSMPPTNKIQAYMPAGARPLVNNIGTAPGIMADTGGKLFVAMPGVPSEMKQMFEQSVLPHLEELACDQAVAVRKLRCFGTGESNIAQILGTVMQRGRNPLINSTARYGIITLHVIATAKDKDKARQMALQDEKMLRDKLGEFVYGTGRQGLAEVVGEKLARHNKTIAVAESCTGGTLAKLLTDIPGASRYFTAGWVTYSNAAKTGQLDVPAELIDKFGAVSEQTAQAMAKNARKKAGADFAVGITGIAGPSGAGKQKPVGLVYISVDCSGSCETRAFIFSGDRANIRLRAANTALNMLRLRLQN